MPLLGSAVFEWNEQDLSVTCENGKSDVAVLHCIDDDDCVEPCIMTGELEEEKAMVSVNGCPGDDSFFVSY